MQNKALTNVYGQAPLKAINIEVTENMVTESRQCNFNKCMVANAIHHHFGGEAKYIHVDTSIIRFSFEGLRYYFVPPNHVKDKIARFDRGENVPAFKFRTDFLAKVTPMGFAATHPKGDNRTNPRKQYKKSDKKRNYPGKVRVNGVCNLVVK